MAHATDSNRLQWEKSQVVDRPRQPDAWHWINGKSKELYERQVKGKWWSPDQLKVKVKDRHVSHIGRIMETELGEELFGSSRCDACIRAGFECFRYSKDGAAQVFKPGSACARCRAEAKHGCSLSKYKTRRRVTQQRGDTIAKQSRGPSLHSPLRVQEASPKPKKPPVVIDLDYSSKETTPEPSSTASQGGVDHGDTTCPGSRIGDSRNSEPEVRPGCQAQ